MTTTFENRTDWLEWRRNGIGGSDIAALLGWSPWASPTSIYLDKQGLLDHDETHDNEAMRWGRLLEDAIADEFQERTGLTVVAAQTCHLDPYAPHRRCTVDGLVTDHIPDQLDGFQALADTANALGILEIKNTGVYTWDSIPEQYEVQCQWNMGVTGHQHAWLAVLHAGRQLRIHELDHDPAAYEALCETADDFWQEHVIAQQPPPPDWTDPTTRALKNAYRHRAQPVATELDNTPAHAALLAWQPTKARLKALEQELALLENTIRQELGPNEIGTINGVEMVTWKAQKAAAQLDRDLMKADGIYDKYLKPQATTRVLRPTKRLKEPR